MDPKQKKIIDYLYKQYMVAESEGTNANRIKEKLSKMSTPEFAKFMKGLKSGEEHLDLLCPNMKVNIRVDNLLKALESAGINIFSRLVTVDPISKQKVMTNEKFMVLKLPVRRAIQSLKLKSHFADDDKHIDQASGQVVSHDEAAKISAPEAESLNAKSLDKLLIEVLNMRGGNVGSWAQMKNALEETGECNMSDIVPLTRTRSVVTTKNLYTALHFDTNL